MKSIDLAVSAPTLSEVLGLAGEENVILKTSEGREYFITELDDLDEEVALVRQNPELLEFLRKRSQDSTRIPLSEVRKQLGIS